MCVTVTLLDGLVLARSGFNHSVNFRSVMALGTAHLVTDDGEAEGALETFVERLYPGRWSGLRPMTPKERKATTVLWMDLDGGLREDPRRHQPRRRRRGVADLGGHHPGQDWAVTSGAGRVRRGRARRPPRPASPVDRQAARDDRPAFRGATIRVCPASPSAAAAAARAASTGAGSTPGATKASTVDPAPDRNAPSAPAARAAPVRCGSSG